ncbi:Hypothetical predicted protein [Pelobates cultripes]|uniref:Uncharacterized protein n=1 Tax=Pelobates cultripes TaxID=61616 RepID=A0AAD1RJ51_PELCU|nr:Hypothetical predicted protein [Pelobates cultripes]
MGGGKKTRNSTVAPIFRQRGEQARAPSSEHSPPDSDAEMGSQSAPDQSEAPLTRRDMQGFIADFGKTVADELDRKRWGDGGGRNTGLTPSTPTYMVLGLRATSWATQPPHTQPASDRVRASQGVPRPHPSTGANPT